MQDGGPTANDGGLRTRGESGLEAVERGAVVGNMGGDGRLSTPEQPKRTPES